MADNSLGRNRQRNFCPFATSNFDDGAGIIFQPLSFSNRNWFDAAI
jgi:hypothetical protein